MYLDKDVSTGDGALDQYKTEQNVSHILLVIYGGT
jgi:hypothetical protein